MQFTKHILSLLILFFSCISTTANVCISIQIDEAPTIFLRIQTDAALYVNPYFIVTPKGYTKYIFNGSQRVATHPGKTGLTESIDTTAAAKERLQNARAYMQSVFNETTTTDIDADEVFVDIDGDDYDELQLQCMDYDEITTDIQIISDSDMLLSTIMYGDTTITEAHPVYHYHTDHLGSAT